MEIDDKDVQRTGGGEGPPEDEALRAIWDATGGLPRYGDRQAAWAAISAAMAADRRRARSLNLTPSRTSASRGVPRWVTALVAVGSVVGLVVGLRAVRSSPTLLPRTYATARGERATVRLADGTQVMLAPASRLTVPANYGRTERSVSLNGEGWFTVVHNPRDPFAVTVHGAVVRDVGTTFDVRAYESDAVVRVTVASGTVAVDAGHDRTVPMLAGDLALIAGERVAVTHAGDIADIVAWTTGRPVFTHVPLGQVAAELGRWYDIDVEVADTTLARQPITMTFAAESATDVLNATAAAVGAHIEHHGHTMVITS